MRFRKKKTMQVETMYLRFDVIQSVKDPIDARLHARPVRVQQDLFEPITSLLFVSADADGERLSQVGHVRFAVQLGEIAVHHQFE